MGAILEQLELNESFFIQLIIFAAVFFILRKVYFQPFLKLIEMRHQKTVADREAAERMMQQAQDRLEEYKKRLGEERAEARKYIEGVLNTARKEEASLLSQARDEARKITQDAADSAAAQRKELTQQLEIDVEGLARAVSEKLLSRKV